VRHVAERIALVREMPVDQLIQVTGENARRVFQLQASASDS
jgi:Tat protein secretion system quality control protein TatD with DNase activity